MTQRLEKFPSFKLMWHVYFSHGFTSFTNDTTLIFYGTRSVKLFVTHRYVNVLHSRAIYWWHDDKSIFSLKNHCYNMINHSEWAGLCVIHFFTLCAMNIQQLSQKPVSKT